MVRLKVGGPAEFPALAPISDVQHAVIVVVVVARITEAVLVVVQLSGVGHGGAVVEGIAHAVSILVEVGVNANHLVFAVVDVVEVAVGSNFDAHDGRG